MQDIQVYTERVIIEAMGNVTSATLMKVDLSEITAQISMESLLDNYSYEDIANYQERRKQEDAE